MKLAVVGTGIAGLTAAYRLEPEHELTVFEARPRLGGHTHTMTLPGGDREWEVDTGFIVYNERTYPRFCALLDELGVATRESTMSFSVRDERSGLEYNGHDANALFAQRRNLLRPSFWRMLREILRFNRECRELLEQPDDTLTLGQYLERGSWSRAFREHYLLPMGGAVWSTGLDGMLEFPALSFVRFFHNHGFLDLADRPVWRTIQGGSRRYVQRLTTSFRERIRLSCPVERVERRADHVLVTPRGGEPERFDGVVLACHSDQALRLLADPSAAEREILGALPYQRNDVVVHTDTSLMPRARRAWAAWNAHVDPGERRRVSVTYDMNILQGLDAPVEFLVTLNHHADIDPSKVLHELSYSHPLFSTGGVAAQRRHAEISGTRRTFYCGAYWSNGFHEDGVRSGERVVEQVRALAASARPAPVEV